MIITILPKQYKNILHLFYDNHNSPLHLREISRRINLRESALSRHLNKLEKNGILKSEKEANLKKYSIRKQEIPGIFQIFDEEKLESLPLIRKNAIKEYLKALQNKPIILIVFGFTAKGIYTKDLDIGLLHIYSKNADTEAARLHAEALTGIKPQVFRISEEQFYKELIEKQDHVIQAAIATGFSAFNSRYFYELKYDERAVPSPVTNRRQGTGKKDKRI